MSCFQIDAVLNFANTNSGNSTSKKAFSQQEAGKSKRRQTYAVYEQQEQQQEHQHLTHPSDDISALSSMIIVSLCILLSVSCRDILSFFLTAG